MLLLLCRQGERYGQSDTGASSGVRPKRARRRGGRRVKAQFATLHNSVILLRDATPSVFINVTLDGSCDHRVMIADEELHRHAIRTFAP